MLRFQCKPPPGSRNVPQNIPYSRIRSVFGHLLAFGGAIPASFHTKQGSPRREPLGTLLKIKPRRDRGGTSGVSVLGQVWGICPAKLDIKPKTYLNVPKNFGNVTILASVVFRIFVVTLPASEDGLSRPLLFPYLFQLFVRGVLLTP